MLKSYRYYTHWLYRHCRYIVNKIASYWCCFEQGADDSEGLGVTSRPSSPLLEVEAVGPEDTGLAAHPSSGLQSGARKGHNAGASLRRAKKRARIAPSGHQPYAYVTKPSTVTHHAEELKLLRVSVDIESFPASGSGAWVGRREKGVKKKPWTVPDLVQKILISSSGKAGESCLLKFHIFYLWRATVKRA